MSRTKIPVSAWICLFVAFALPGKARADTVRVTSGFLLMSGITGRMELMGERDFSLSSAVDIAGGIFLPHAQCVTAECVPRSI